MKKFTYSISAALLLGAYLIAGKIGGRGAQISPPALLSLSENGGRLSGQNNPQDQNLPSPTPSALGTPAPTPTPAAKNPPPNPTPTPTQKPAPIITSTPTPAPAGAFKDGQYTGTAEDAYYGYVEVAAVISGGKLSDVKFLQYPNDRRTSLEINSQALPYLRTEAIAAQSARVQIISGATDTSQAFRASLAAALRQAKN